MTLDDLLQDLRTVYVTPPSWRYLYRLEGGCTVILRKSYIGENQRLTTVRLRPYFWQFD